MSDESLLKILDFNVGDKVWWFKYSLNACTYSGTISGSIRPGDLDLVQDTIKEIKDGLLCCWHSIKRPQDIWGKTREEAWAKLKSDLEKWGNLE